MLWAGLVVLVVVLIAIRLIMDQPPAEFDGLTDDEREELNTLYDLYDCRALSNGEAMRIHELERKAVDNE